MTEKSLFERVFTLCCHQHISGVKDHVKPFKEELKGVLDKTCKTIELLCKLHNILPRAAWNIIYKAVVMPHPNYGHILYDKAYDNTFHWENWTNSI